MLTLKKRSIAHALQCFLTQSSVEREAVPNGMSLADCMLDNSLRSILLLFVSPVPYTESHLLSGTKPKKGYVQ